MTGVDANTERLVAIAKSGDGAAREELFARYLPRVSHMVAMRLGVPRASLPATAEDVAQEALLRAIGALDRFEMRSPGAFHAWMATIVLNCIRKQAKRSGNGNERTLWQRYGDLDLHESIFASDDPSPSRTIAAREANARVEAALLDLPGLYREAVSLRFLGQMSHTEIAHALGRTEANSRKIVQRGLQMLQAALRMP